MVVGGLLNPEPTERLRPCFSLFCGWPRQQSPCGRDWDCGCGVITSSKTSGTIAQTSAVMMAVAVVWHCRAAVGGVVLSSQQELWPYPFSYPLFIISTVAVRSRLQQEEGQNPYVAYVYCHHCSIHNASTAPPLSCFHCINPLPPADCTARNTEVENAT